MTDRDDLLKSRLPEADVDTPAGVVRVRGLSRREVLQSRDVLEQGAEGLDQFMLERGLVDPKLTPDEVRQWRDAWTKDDIEAVSERIAELSGMTAEEEDVDRSFPADA